MPIDGRVFYRKNSNSSSESSKLRWPRKNGYSSSLVIPPTEMSEPLSAPTSGCSSAKGSVNTSPAKSERFLKPSKLDTDKLSGSLTTSRFARYLTKQQDQGHHGRTNPTTAKEVLSKAVGKEPVPASSYLRDAVGPPNPLEKCKLWIEKGCSEQDVGNSDKHELSTPLKQKMTMHNEVKTADPPKKSLLQNEEGDKGKENNSSKPRFDTPLQKKILLVDYSPSSASSRMTAASRLSEKAAPGYVVILPRFVSVNKSDSKVEDNHGNTNRKDLGGSAAREPATISESSPVSLRSKQPPKSGSSISASAHNKDRDQCSDISRISNIGTQTNRSEAELKSSHVQGQANVIGHGSTHALGRGGSTLTRDDIVPKKCSVLLSSKQALRSRYGNTRMVISVTPATDSSSAQKKWPSQSSAKLSGTLQPTEMENFCPSDTAGSGTLVLSTTAPCGRTSASVTPATDSSFAQEKLPSQSSAQLSGTLQPIEMGNFCPRDVTAKKTGSAPLVLSSSAPCGKTTEAHLATKSTVQAKRTDTDNILKQQNLNPRKQPLEISTVKRRLAFASALIVSEVSCPDPQSKEDVDNNSGSETKSLPNCCLDSCLNPGENKAGKVDDLGKGINDSCLKEQKDVHIKGTDSVSNHLMDGESKKSTKKKSKKLKGKSSPLAVVIEPSQTRMAAGLEFEDTELLPDSLFGKASSAASGLEASTTPVRKHHAACSRVTRSASTKKHPDTKVHYASDDSNSDTSILQRPISIFASSGSDEWRKSENTDYSSDETELKSKGSKKKKKLLKKRIQKERSSSHDEEADSPQDHNPHIPLASTFTRECNKSEEELSASSTERAPTKKFLKAMRKELRSAGKEYTTQKGKVIRERKFKLPHVCKRLKCQDIITYEVGKEICEEYYALKSFNERRLYISSRVEVLPKQRTRIRKDGSGINRTSNVHYHLFVKSKVQVGNKVKFVSKKTRVCRETFLNTLDETDAFVRRIVAAKTSSGTIKKDQRGKQPPKHKLSADSKDQVLQHIDSYPKYVSHYSRKQTKQKFLPSTLSIETMYQDYLECGYTKVSLSTYRRIFKTQNLKFKSPASDTCAKCDQLQLQIASLKDVGEQIKLMADKELHIRKADKAYLLKQEAKKAACQDPAKAVLVFDLEQCLPTPHVPCGKAFYARQLYTYNLTIYDATSKLTYCYMWSENENARGANQIASCIYYHMLHFVPRVVTHVKLFSDSCTGQNKNSIVVAMFQVVLQETGIQTIDHIFLVPGHTRMECDNKHSVIERAKEKVATVDVPEGWYDLVKKAGQKNPDKFPDGKFQVIRMVEEFYDFEKLFKGPFVKREVTTDGERMYFQPTSWFRYQKGKLGKVLVKSSYNEDADFKVWDILRGPKAKQKQSNLDLSTLLESLPTTAFITFKKKKDLIQLLPYVQQKYHPFYHGLQACTKVRKGKQVASPEKPAKKSSRPTARNRQQDSSGEDDPDLPSDNENY